MMMMISNNNNNKWNFINFFLKEINIYTKIKRYLIKTNQKQNKIKITYLLIVKPIIIKKIIYQYMNMKIETHTHISFNTLFVC